MADKEKEVIFIDTDTIGVEELLGEDEDDGENERV